MNRVVAAYLNPNLPVGVALDEARGTPQRWGRVPRTFIRTSNRPNRAARPAGPDDRRSRRGNTPRNPFQVHTLTSSHSPFASMADALAEVLSDG
jgi:hypothetical protein